MTKTKPFDENTIIVCPECGVEIMSLTVNDEDGFKMVDYEEPCRQCEDITI